MSTCFNKTLLSKEAREEKRASTPSMPTDDDSIRKMRLQQAICDTITRWVNGTDKRLLMQETLVVNLGDVVQPETLTCWQEDLRELGYIVTVNTQTKKMTITENQPTAS